MSSEQVNVSKVLEEIKNNKLLANVRFLGKIRLSLEIESLSGILIAGGAEEIEIGKIDKVFIRDPVTNLPYIPGSSLKGVMRSMLEYKYNLPLKDGIIHNCNKIDCNICRVYGTTEDALYGPTRIHVIDGFLSKKTRRELEEKGLWSYVELKTENLINRVLGRAENPRTFERVPPGSVFDSAIDYLVFSVNVALASEESEIPTDVIKAINRELDWREDIEAFRYVLEGLVLVEDHGLGASISRGYGKVRILINDIEVRNLSYYSRGEEPVKISIKELIGKDKASPAELLQKFSELKEKLEELLNPSTKG